MNDLRNPSLHPVLISLGSNINPEKNILSASKLLTEIDFQPRFSTVWESSAVGSNGPNYLNGAVLIETNLPQERIKTEIIFFIENKLGRIRSVDKFMDRTIDLDILIFDTCLLEPEVWTLAHLALPASELWPNFKNASTGELLAQAADRLRWKTNIFQRTDLILGT